MVVFFRWGDNIHHPTGNGHSAATCPGVVMPSPSATNMGFRGFSYETGHYFGLAHTFGPQFGSVAEASEFLKNHGGDMSVFDGDQLSDTLPDPGLPIAYKNGVRHATLDGKKVLLPTGNIMSYVNWDVHEWMSNQQAERVRAFCRFRSRFGMVYPTNIDAPHPIEAESLPIEARGDLSAASQQMAGFIQDGWSGDTQVWGQGHVGGSLLLKFEVTEPGPQGVTVYMTFAPEKGKVDISLDGKRTGQTFDGYAPLVAPSGPISLGRFDLSPGAHTIEFTVVGKNAESDGESLGVDCLSLVAVKP